MRYLVVLACALSAIGAVSCSGAAGSPAADLTPAANQVPLPAFLDSLRGPSAIADQSIPVDTPLLSAHTAPAGPAITLAAPDGDLAFAIYRVDPPDDAALLDVSAAGTGALWLLTADFGSGHWQPQQAFSGNAADIDLGLLTGPSSPAGFFYVAVVCAGGQSGTLTDLSLRVDTLEPAGPTYYVAPDGDDTADGSEAAPWLTLQHAADSVVAGDTVVVRPGQYAGMHIQSSGTDGQWIRFLAEPGAEITVDNGNTSDGINIENWDGPPAIAYVEVNGFTINGRTRAGIRIAGSQESFAHHILVTNNSCDSNGMWGILSGHVDDLTVSFNECSRSVGEHGIYLSNSGDRNVARGNTCYSNNFSGIQFNADASLGGDGIMSEALIENNVLYDNGSLGGAALNMDGLQDSVIRNNLLYGNHATGLVMYSGDGLGSQRNLVVHNTIVQAADGRFCVTINTDSGGNRLYNNVFQTRHSFRGIIDIDSASLSGFESDYNAVMDRFIIDDGDTLTLAEWQTETAQDLHSIVATEAQLFADGAADDYHLKLGSPAVDAGLAGLVPATTLDLEGLTRPVGAGYDTGCHELQIGE
jgi:hypothetical protein